MQAIVPTYSERNPNGHTEQEIRDALAGVSGARRWSFRYALLDTHNKLLQYQLDNVISCEIQQAWLADIKRTAKFVMKDTGVIDWLSDRIQPFIRLHLYPYGAKDWVEWPQGVFLLSAPKRSDNSTGLVTRDVEGFDQTQWMADDIPIGRQSFAKTANVVDTVRVLVPNESPATVAPNTATMGVVRSWDPGTTRLRIANDLLDKINYDPVHFDEEGRAVVRPYRYPSERGAEWTYSDTTDTGLIIPGAEHVKDLTKVPNRWVLVVSEPNKPELRTSYTNTNPESLTSTVSRGRTITDFRTVNGMNLLSVLNAYAKALAHNASQIYEEMNFSTGMNPLHSHNDIYNIRYQPLDINAKYAETSWSLQLKAGARMQHSARRMVTV
jgi:hypothetical protein